MIYGLGTDIVEVDRIKNSIEKYGNKFLNKVFTEIEISYCESYKDTKYPHYAARFAVKEAFSKAIGTGFTKGFKLNEIGVKNEENGKPVIELFGSLSEKWSSYKLFLSLSHSNINATASVIIEK